MSKLLHSKAFWTGVINSVCSTILYFVGKYAAPSVFEDIKFIIAVYQPLALGLLAAFLSDEVGVALARATAMLNSRYQDMKY